MRNQTATSKALGDPSVLNADEVARRLDTDLERGLDVADASRRLARHGRNVLPSAPPVPAWRQLLAQFRSPLVYLLLVAIGASLVAWAAKGRQDWPVDAVIIGLIVVLNAALGYAQEASAQRAVAALARMTAVTCAVIRDGRRDRVPSAELVPGDLLLLEEGDAIGADARLIEATSLRLQEASLTGESEAVLKDAAAISTEPTALADRLGMVFKGTAVVQGTGRAVVTATGMDTQVGLIAGMLEATEEAPTPLQAEIGRLGRMLGAAVIVVATVVMATIFLAFDVHDAADVVTVLLLGVSLAVAAVPEGLPAILSVVLALGVRRMAKRNAIVKKLSSVETLGSASVICSDKTGTLTRSEMTIERVMTASGSTRITGIGYAPEGRVEQENPGPRADALRVENVLVLSGGSLASNASLREREGEWEILGDPTEAAFLVAERKLGATARREQRFERIGEIPFSSERKLMSAVARDREHGDEPVLVTKGAPDVLLGRCSAVRTGMDVVVLDDETRKRILAGVDELSDAALRTLSVAYRPLAPGEDQNIGEALEHDLIFAGTVGIIDPPRPEAAVAIREAQRAGIRVIMITGDHPRTAARIAADLGIVAAGVPALTGLELDELDDEAFARVVRVTSIYARVSPAHKLRIVDALQIDGNIVAMTGDGVNDAPALRSADIGVAMGLTGTEVTKEASDMILADDNFATIVEAVREGRHIFDNIRKFLRYLLSSNIGEVLTVFLGVVLAEVIGLTGSHSAIVLPLLATQILWINLITDLAPALAIGMDPETDDAMARMPRQPTERMIDARMWVGALEVGTVMALATLFTIDLYLPGGLIEGAQGLDNARTAGFTVLVLAQMFNCFNARSETITAFRHLFVNSWLWGAVALGVLLQVMVVNVGVLNVAFGTVPLQPNQWLVCVAMASLVLWFSELRKLLIRLSGNGSTASGKRVKR